MVTKDGGSKRTLQSETRERDEELLNTVLRSFEVARQNLRDTQLSPDTVLVYYYEAAALALRRDTSKTGRADREDDAKRYFEIASTLGNVLQAFQSKLLDLSDEDDKFIVLSFHARYNLIVLEHRQVESQSPGQAAAPRLRTVREQYLDLSKQITDLISNLHSLHNSLSQRLSGSLSGVRIAAACGALSCDYFLLREAAPALSVSEKQERVKEISAASAQLRTALENTRSAIKKFGRADNQNPLLFSIATSIANIEKQSTKV